MHSAWLARRRGDDWRSELTCHAGLQAEQRVRSQAAGPSASTSTVTERDAAPGPLQRRPGDLSRRLLRARLRLSAGQGALMHMVRPGTAWREELSTKP